MKPRFVERTFQSRTVSLEASLPNQFQKNHLMLWGKLFEGQSHIVTTEAKGI